jgi:hypothetical protein
MTKRKPRVFQMDPAKAALAAFAGDDLSKIPPEKLEVAEKAIREAQNAKEQGTQKI